MKNSFQTHYLLFALLAGVFFAGLCSLPAAAQTGGTMKIKIYLAKEDPDADNEVVAVERTVKKSTRVAETTVRELLKGATRDDLKNGLTSAYEVEDIVTGREECRRATMKPLAAYLIGVSIRRGVATVNFRPEAECYLQSAAFQMSRVMNPIEATLKQFKNVREVRYALNGRVITDWDA